LQFFVVLSEEGRAAAIRLSGTPGGDGVAAYVDVLTGVIMDVGQNLNVVNQSFQLIESADVIKPVALSGFVDYGTGLLNIRVSETVKALDLTKIRVVDQINDANFPMTTAAVISVDSVNPQIKLTEALRLSCLAISGTPGGNGYMEWTMGFTATTATWDQGSTATQANGYLTWTILINPVTIVESAGATVTQTSQSGTGTLKIALTGAGVLAVKIKSAVGVVFDTTAPLIVGGVTVQASDINSASSLVTPDATGTVKTSINGAVTEVIITTATVGIVFDTDTNLVMSGGVNIGVDKLTSATSATFGNVLIDLDSGAIKDVANNFNNAQTGIAVGEAPDTIPPIVLSSTLDYTTGILTITSSETVDVTPSSLVYLESMFISDLTGDHAVSLVGATVTSVSDDPTITLQLTEAQRVLAIKISGVPGGDTDAVVLDAEPGSLTDITGNDPMNARLGFMFVWFLCTLYFLM